MLITAPFWDIIQRIAVIYYRRLRATSWSHFRVSECHFPQIAQRMFILNLDPNNTAKRLSSVWDRGRNNDGYKNRQIMKQMLKTAHCK
jgi:hypothetical protein